jgi:hypothetical protein
MTRWAPEDRMTRFMKKIAVQESGCWLWTGGAVPQGYGAFYWDENERTCRANRAAYRLFIGDIPDGMVIMHKCDVPACVNPAHLQAGTLKENTRDMLTKKRHRTNPRFGDDNWTRQNPEKAKAVARLHAKITMNIAEEIRREYAKGGVKQKDLAVRYGLKQPQVSSIIRKASWV